MLDRTAVVVLVVALLTIAALGVALVLRGLKRAWRDRVGPDPSPYAVLPPEAALETATRSAALRMPPLDFRRLVSSGRAWAAVGVYLVLAPVILATWTLLWMEIAARHGAFQGVGLAAPAILSLPVVIPCFVLGYPWADPGHLRSLFLGPLANAAILHQIVAWHDMLSWQRGWGKRWRRALAIVLWVVVAGVLVPFGAFVLLFLGPGGVGFDGYPVPH